MSTESEGETRRLRERKGCGSDSVLWSGGSGCVCDSEGRIASERACVVHGRGKAVLRAVQRFLKPVESASDTPPEGSGTIHWFVKTSSGRFCATRFEASLARLTATEEDMRPRAQPWVRTLARVLLNCVRSERSGSARSSRGRDGAYGTVPPFAKEERVVHIVKGGAQRVDGEVVEQLRVVGRRVQVPQVLSEDALELGRRNRVKSAASSAGRSSVP